MLSIVDLQRFIGIVPRVRSLHAAATSFSPRQFSSSPHPPFLRDVVQ
jgi:hypothetical protein